MATFLAIVGLCCLLIGIATITRRKRKPRNFFAPAIVVGGLLVIALAGLLRLDYGEIEGGNYNIHIAINPSNSFIYVSFGPTSSGSDYVSVIDTASNRVVRNMKVPDSGRSVMSPSGSRLYLTRHFNIACQTEYFALPDWFIDMRTNEVLYAPPEQKESLKPLEGCVIAPSGNRASASTLAAQAMLDPPFSSKVSRDEVISVIDLATRKILTSVDIGGLVLPPAMTMNQQGTRIYVAAVSSVGSTAAVTNISVIDTSTNEVAGVMRLQGPAHEIAVNIADTRLYVVSDRTVAVVDTATKNQVATVRVCPPLRFWMCW